jgi:hypothetical protein
MGLSKYHLLKVEMILAQVMITLAAEQFDFPQYLGLIVLRCKAAIIVLHIKGGEDAVGGLFYEVAFIAALGAADPSGRLSVRQSDFFHLVFLNSLAWQLKRACCESIACLALSGCFWHLICVGGLCSPIVFVSYPEIHLILLQGNGIGLHPGDLGMGRAGAEPD